MNLANRKRFLFWTAILGLFCLGTSYGLRAAEQSDAQAKQTFMAPMRDGMKLGTDVYLPSGEGPFPVILMRVPYNKNNFKGLGKQGVEHGYAVVIQDTRGRFASEGENLPFEADGWANGWDGYDTLEWIAAQKWCNGKIGTVGGSAGGITQLLAAGSGSKRITCQHIVVAGDMYQLIYPGGVYKKAMIDDWLKGNRFSLEGRALWARHPAYDGFWRARDLSLRYDKINTPAIHVGGWYDIFLQGTIDAFTGYQTKGGRGARGKQKLVIGPWPHAAMGKKTGELAFPKSNEVPGNVHDSYKWFDYWLKGVDNSVSKAPAVAYYVMGDVSDPNAPGNVWRTADKWPPVAAKMTPFYLLDDRALSASKPAKGKPLAYSYDPKDPVPTVGGPQLTLPAGAMDQRKIESRPDVLVFTSEPLSEPVEVTGRVRACLWASSDAPDTDFAVKLCDVYPDGRSINICEGILRARFRDSLEQEEMMKPGKVCKFPVDLWTTSIIFNKGHRIRVHITSSSSPGYDPNPNTGEPFRASEKTQVAHNTIYVDAKHPSHILLPVAGGKLP